MKIFKILKQLFCKHSFDSIILEDVEWDRQNDNDDLEDTPSFIEVTYCQKCGKIINVTRFYIIDSIMHFKIPSKYYSDMYKYGNFKKVTGVDPKNFPSSKYI